MIKIAALCLSTLQLYYIGVSGQAECIDLRGRHISHGIHYVPGPDTCTLCVCDNGSPKVCKAVLCSPPQDCRSFRVGNTCCDFICLDDVVKPLDGTESTARMAAYGVSGAALLTVSLVVYRVYKRWMHEPRETDEQRSTTSIGYISGTMGYMGGTCETAITAWKPQGNHLPRGEAPPPYDEVVANCNPNRPDVLRMTTEAFHRTYPSTLESLARPEEVLCANYTYTNIPRPVQQVANTQNCYNAPLLQTMHPVEQRDPNMPHHPQMPMAMPTGFPSAIRLTGSLGAISNRPLLSLLQREEPERPHNVPGFYTNNHTAMHRTIPRISTAIDTLAVDTFRRTPHSLHNEIRRSFHKPDPRPHTRRSMPRNLNLVSSTDINRNIELEEARFNNDRSRAHSEERNINVEPKTPLIKPITMQQQPEVPLPPNSLPLTIDKPSCVCSYEGTNAVATEDGDDYRSECENCKSAGGSRWVLVEEGWAAASSQTLQRVAPPAPPSPPATATLPQPVTRPSRNIMGPPSNWENWFNTIPDSDTESEEE